MKAKPPEPERLTLWIEDPETDMRYPLGWTKNGKHRKLRLPAPYAMMVAAIIETAGLECTAE